MGRSSVWCCSWCSNRRCRALFGRRTAAAARGLPHPLVQSAVFLPAAATCGCRRRHGPHAGPWQTENAGKGQKQQQHHECCGMPVEEVHKEDAGVTAEGRAWRQVTEQAGSSDQDCPFASLSSEIINPRGNVCPARARRATFTLCSPRRAPKHTPWKRP